VRKSRHKKKEKRNPPPNTHNEDHPQDELAKFGSNSKKKKNIEKKIKETQNIFRELLAF